jgi:hypothetical protein
MCPLFFSSSPNTAASKLDFPAPIDPTMATRDPFFTRKLIFFRVGVSSFQSKLPPSITMGSSERRNKLRHLNLTIKLKMLYSDLNLRGITIL